MFERSLERIREKPEEEKRKIALFWSTSITILVAVLWFLNLSFILPDKEKAQASLVVSRGEVVEANKSESGMIAKIKETPSFFKESLDSVFVGAGVLKEEIKKYLK